MKTKNLYRQLATVLSAGAGNSGKSSGFFSAAVLVPLIWQDGQLAVVFEVRSAQLSRQPGEICFPGGHIEEQDANALEAALRETSEELGIAVDMIEVLGSLGEFVSPIGVKLYPFLGCIVDGVTIKPSQEEVAEIFTVPLAFLLTAEPIVGHMEAVTRPLADFPFSILPDYSPEWKRRTTYPIFFYQYQQYVIWGLTAQVLKHFLHVCRLAEI